MPVLRLDVPVRSYLESTSLNWRHLNLGLFVDRRGGVVGWRCDGGDVATREHLELRARAMLAPFLLLGVALASITVSARDRGTPKLVFNQLEQAKKDEAMDSSRLILRLALTLGLASSLAVCALSGQQPSALSSTLESPALRLVSDEDLQLMQQIKHHIANEYSEFKSVNEVHAFLDKVKLLVQKHPKNVAFAQAELRELLKFLSQESVARLIRLDSEPFVMPISEDRIPLAQRAVDEDELTRKLFGGPLRSLVEARRQQVSRTEDGNHKDGNFFASFWCKISGGCPNQ